MNFTVILKLHFLQRLSVKFHEINPPGCLVHELSILTIKNVFEEDTGKQKRDLVLAMISGKFTTKSKAVIVPAGNFSFQLF